MSFRPTRDQILVSNEPVDHNEGGSIQLIVSQTLLCRKRVLSCGPGVSDEINEGDLVFALGEKSGVDVGDGTFIISEEICVAIQDK